MTGPLPQQPLLSFEKSRPGRRAWSLPSLDVPEADLNSVIPAALRRAEPAPLPELGELDVARHFTLLSQRNFAIDSGFYPLGSCTMKYNPKINEKVARLPGFASLHPHTPAAGAQGALALMYELSHMLAEITGMDAVSLQPAAGAQGEFTGLAMIDAYHHSRGERRTKVLIPGAAHGTNPATAAMLGMRVVPVRTTERAGIDLEDLRRACTDEVAALMLTNPDTLGLFEENIHEVARIVHEAGGLLYYDGANANAILGYSRPGDMGFDVVHLNLHKTFSTPHGGGGPGSGPVGVKAALKPFLPSPLVTLADGRYGLDEDRPQSIGKVHSFFGNYGMLVRAYAYILAHGPDGLKAVSENAVLNANYLQARLRQTFDLPHDRVCKHEFVLSAKRFKDEHGVRTLDIAKRLLDYGVHPPTVYFPLVVEEALMIEPTETESKETLDAFVDMMEQIAAEARDDPDLVRGAPHTTVVGRLDEALAARKPNLRWRPETDEQS